MDGGEQPSVKALDAGNRAVAVEGPAVLTEPHSGAFATSWLSEGPKLVVPVPAGTHVDRALVRRTADGCRAGGVGEVLVMTAEGPGASGRPWRQLASAITASGGTPPGLTPSRLAPSRLTPSRLIPSRLTAPITTASITTASDLVGSAAGVLLVASDLQGAVLFDRPGYALVAGTTPFLRGAVPEGVDGGRARFARYARAVADRWPELQSVARDFAPRHIAWAHARDVPDGTATSQQVCLVRDFTAGAIGGADFARGWLNARRAAQESGERLREPLLSAFQQVFLLLEDYSIDPALKDPTDLSDEQLRDAVRKSMARSENS
nr:colicin immunity domain-containing protein [Streptomyces sp. SID4913]